MLFNIKTGRGVEHVPMREIVVLVSSLPHLLASSVRFVFTDRHAQLIAAKFASEMDQLDAIDWEILASSDFKRDDAELSKLERYQAERSCIDIARSRD